MLKKSYTGFILWVVGFCAALMGIALCGFEDEALLIRLILLLMAWGIALMAFIIWRTEQVYWYNGISYEEAVNAGHERRKEFGARHLRVFYRFALLQTLVSCGMHLLGWSEWIDFTVGTVGLIVTAISTVKIKL